MLGKLMRYELKATARNFLPIYLGIICVSIIMGLTLSTGWSFEQFDISMIFVLVFMALFIALAVMTLLTIIQRFYNNVLGDQGYLMFTLPVKSGSLILSKWFTSMIWFICSCITTAIAGAILVVVVSEGEVIKIILDPWYWEQLFGIYEWEQLGLIAGIWVALPLNMVIGFGYFVSRVYLAMAIGQLPCFHRYRMPVSFIAFFAIEILLRLVFVIATMFVGDLDFSISFSPEMWVQEWYTVMVVLLGVAAGYLVLTGAMLAGTNYILKKHLNLQ